MVNVSRENSYNDNYYMLKVIFDVYDTSKSYGCSIMSALFPFYSPVLTSPNFNDLTFSKLKGFFTNNF